MKSLILIVLSLFMFAGIANAGGGYHYQPDPLTFEVKAYNGSSSDVKAQSNTFTNKGHYRYHGHSRGGNVYGNDIETVAIGANANLDARVDCNCEGRYFKAEAVNYGDVSAQSNTWSNVGNVQSNTISTVAIGASASGSYRSTH